MSVSVLILTFNEEQNLPQCIDSVRWADEILIVDSGSTDNTIAIAESMGAKVLTRAFDNFANQRNFGLEVGKPRNPWVLHLDADERVRPELATELQTIAKENPKKAYRVASRVYFCGSWLKRSGMYPSYQVRFGRSDHLFFKMVGHGQRETVPLSDVATLQHDLDHFTFSKGLHAWLEKHNRYSSDEAEHHSGASKRLNWNSFWKGGLERRRFLKQLFFKLPFRPQIRFLYLYVYRMGFLDGRAGLQYAQLLTMYERMIDLKMAELAGNKEPTPPSPE